MSEFLQRNLNPDSLLYYQSPTGYKEINGILRMVLIPSLIENPKLKQHVDEIDRNMTYNQTGTTVYRGFKSLLEVLGPNGTFTEYAYSSTSTNIDYAHDKFTEGGCCLLKLIIPPTIRSYEYVYRNDTENKEWEILLQRGLVYTVDTEQVYVFNHTRVYPCTVSPALLPERNKVIENCNRKTIFSIPSLSEEQKLDIIKNVYESNEDFPQPLTKELIHDIMSNVLGFKDEIIIEEITRRILQEPGDTGKRVRRSKRNNRKIKRKQSRQGIKRNKCMKK